MRRLRRRRPLREPRADPHGPRRRRHRVSPLDLYVARLPPERRALSRPAHPPGLRRLRAAAADGALAGHRCRCSPSAPPGGAPSPRRCARRRRAALIAAWPSADAAGPAGRRFPAGSSLLAPLWVLERGVCAWLAVLAAPAVRRRPLRRDHPRPPADRLAMTHPRRAGSRQSGWSPRSPSSDRDAARAVPARRRSSPRDPQADDSNPRIFRAQRRSRSQRSAQPVQACRARRSRQETPATTPAGAHGRAPRGSEPC